MRLMDRSTLTNWLDRLEKLDADAHGHVQSYVAANALAHIIGTPYDAMSRRAWILAVTFVNLKTKQQEGNMLPLDCLRRLFNHLKEIAYELMGDRLHDIVIETPSTTPPPSLCQLGVDVSDPTRTHLKARSRSLGKAPHKK